MDHADPYMPPALLDPTTQQRFVNAVPVPTRIDMTAGGGVVLDMRETTQWLGLTDEHGIALQTTVWGYGPAGGAASWPGPTIIAESGTPIVVGFRNLLPVGSTLIPVDMHLAMEGSDALEQGLLPAVVHLHGGHTESASDGLPEAWFTQDPAVVGPDYAGSFNTYDNDQRGTALWYHDHAMGLARNNVYAGLAGFYLLHDATEQRLIDEGVLPGRDAETELAIQDRAFTADGQLYYPAYPEDPLPGTDETVADTLPEDYDGPVPTAVPEFFGDVLVVNGMAWPRMTVEGEARLHLLNGSDSRFYLLELDNPWAKLTLVGTDGGLLKHAWTISDGDGVREAGEFLVLAPADRVDLVLDLTDPHIEGPVTLLNRGPAYEPFKGLEADGSLAGGDEPVVAATPDDPVGAVMQFDPAPLAPGHAASVEGGTRLDSDFERLKTPEVTHARRLGLFEVEDEHGRTTPMLGVADHGQTDINGDPVPFGPLPFDAPATEVIQRGAIEKWIIFNFSEDAHPVHLHQVQFQVKSRSEIAWEDKQVNATGERGEDGMPDAVHRTADIALRPEDRGWQDTVWVGPGESIAIEARFDIAGEYVWHCHILSHEDHDMMRPFVVVDELV